MRKYIFCAFLLSILLASHTAHAVQSFKVGLNIWSQNIVGDVEYQGDNADIEKDFDITKPEESVKIYFETENFLPFYPDFRFFYDDFTYKGKTDENFAFGGFIFGENAEVSIGSETLGVTAFYSLEFMDYVGGRAGLDLRKVSFDVRLSGFNANDKNDLEVSYSGSKETLSFIPLLYGEVHGKIPQTGFYVYAEGHVASLQSNTIQDYRYALGVEILWGINMEAGYRRLIYQVKNTSSNVDINLNVKGTFLDFSYKF